jgi:hypothetical protein
MGEKTKHEGLFYIQHLFLFCLLPHALCLSNWPLKATVSLLSFLTSLNHPLFHSQPLFLSSLYLCLYSPLFGLGRLFSFLICYTVGKTPWTGLSLSQGRYLHTGQYKQNKRTQTSMPQMGFEPTIPVFERAKTVHDLDRTATVIGSLISLLLENYLFKCLLFSLRSPYSYWLA